VGSRDPLLEFRDSPADISQTVKAINFKFGTERMAGCSNDNISRKVEV